MIEKSMFFEQNGWHSSCFDQAAIGHETRDLIRFGIGSGQLPLGRTAGRKQLSRALKLGPDA